MDPSLTDYLRYCCAVECYFDQLIFQLQVLDFDGDGTVSYEEFLSGICIFGKGTREEKLKRK